MRGAGAIRLALVMLLIALSMQAASAGEIRVGDRLPEVTLSMHPARRLLEPTPREWKRLRQGSVAKAAA